MQVNFLSLLAKRGAQVERIQRIQAQRLERGGTSWPGFFAVRRQRERGPWNAGLVLLAHVSMYDNRGIMMQETLL